MSVYAAVRVVSGCWSDNDAPELAAPLITAPTDVNTPVREVFDAALRNGVPFEKLFQLAKTVRTAVEIRDSDEWGGITDFLALFSVSIELNQ